MARRTDHEAHQVFIVERFLPGFTLDDLLRQEPDWNDDLEGPSLRARSIVHLESTWVPVDETTLSTYLAVSARGIDVALREQGLAADRIVAGVRIVPVHRENTRKK